MKNDPRFFTSILTTLDDCPAENILFWDDTPANVDTARSTGMVAEIYAGFAFKLRKEVEFVIYISWL